MKISVGGGGVHFSGLFGDVPFHMDSGGTLWYGGSHNWGFHWENSSTNFLPNWQMQDPNLEKWIYRTVTEKLVESNSIILSLLMTLHFCDNLIKCYFDNLGHAFFPLSTLLELQRKLGVFWNFKTSSLQWFYWLSKKFLCCSTVLQYSALE